MKEVLYSHPLGALATLTAVTIVGFYWLGCFLFRPVLRLFVRPDGAENAIVGNVLSAFGVFYGLLLSLIAVAAYQNLSRVEDEVNAEASELLALYLIVSELPEPQSTEFKELLLRYSKHIIEIEWPEQRMGLLPQRGGLILRDLVKKLFHFEPASRRGERFQEVAIDNVKSLQEHGRIRRYATQSGIPRVMWYVVIVGCVLNITLLWLFEMKFVTQLFLGGILTFFWGS